MANILFKIPRYLKQYTVTEQAIIGRIVALSKAGKNEVMYSNDDATLDGFTSVFKNSFAKLSSNGIFSVTKGFRACRKIMLNVEVLEMENCSYILVPQEVMASEKLSFSDKIIFGRIFHLTKQGKEKIKLTTSMICNEFYISPKTAQRSLTTLKEQELLNTETIYNGYTNERFVSVNLNKIQLLSKLTKSGKCQNVITECHDLTLQKSENDPYSCHDLTLSSSSNSEHIYSEHIYSDPENVKAEVIKKENAYPLSSSECEIYFREYIQKYAHTNGALQMVNVPFEASQFFEYWSTRDWKDSKGKKVKSIKGRVATWIGRNIEKYERQYKRSNPLANLKTSEQLCAMYGSIPNPLGVRDESVKVLGFSKDEQDSQQVINDDLPF